MVDRGHASSHAATLLQDQHLVKPTLESFLVNRCPRTCSGLRIELCLRDSLSTHDSAFSRSHVRFTKDERPYPIQSTRRSRAPQY